MSPAADPLRRLEDAILQTLDPATCAHLRATSRDLAASVAPLIPTKEWKPLADQLRNGGGTVTREDAVRHAMTSMGLPL